MKRNVKSQARSLRVLAELSLAKVTAGDNGVIHMEGGGAAPNAIVGGGHI